MLRRILSLFCVFGFGFLLSGCSSVDIASETNSDPSVGLLYQLFTTTLGGSLSGSVSSTFIFPILIQTFNLILVGAAVILFGFTAILGTLYTAQDGIFLGRKWAKTFLPLRMIFGVIAVFPLGASGFGIAQYLIYLMTYTGVAAADKLWSTVAGDVAAGGTAGALSSTVLNNITDGMSELMFYHAIQDAEQPSSLSAKAPSSGPRLGASNSIQFNFPNHNTSSLLGSSSDSNNQVPFSGILGLTNIWFSQLGSAFPNTGTPYQNNFLNALSESCNTLPVSNVAGSQIPNCEAVLTQIQANLRDPSNVLNNNSPIGLIQNTTRIGDLNFSLPSSPTTYLESRFFLDASASGSYITLPTPDLSQPPVALADGYAQGFVSQLEGSASDENPGDAATLLQSITQTFENQYVSNILDALKKQYDSQNTINPSPDVLPQNFGTSWWNAGDEYLYLQELFAQEDGELDKISGEFLSAVNGVPMITLNNASVSADMDAVTLVNEDMMNPQSDNYTTYGSALHPIMAVLFTSKNPMLAIPNNTQVPLSGENTDDPVALAQELEALFNQLNPRPAPGTTGYLAFQDLLCNLGAGPSYCTAAKGYMVPAGSIPTAQTGWNNPPLNVIRDYLSFYLGAKKFFNGNSDATVPENIYVLDEILNFNLAVEGEPICIPNPNDSSQCTPVGQENPMIEFGPNSPMGGVMGYLFSGLLGNSTSPSINGLMGEIWCIGEANFASCLASNGTPASNNPVPGNPQDLISNIVGNHLSVIANAQLVGVNLISGTADAMTNMYTTFSKKVDAIIGQGSSGLSVGDLIATGIPVVGSIAGAFENQSVTDKTQQMIVELAGLSVSMMWLPLVMVVLTVLFTTGVMLAIIIPMTPFVLFWAGKMAWLFLVLESMFAAPLVALAMAYPDGHDIWGMGEQGVKISLNLLLLPMLMIAGLVTAMAITYFVLNIACVSFHTVGMQVLSMAASQGGVTSSGSSGGNATLVTDNSQLMVQGIMSTFMLFMFATFITMAFNKSFSMIYVIPERVMSWIGSQGMKFGEKEADEMKNATMQQANQGAQAGGQSLQQGMQAQKGLGDAKASQMQQDTSAEIQAVQSPGQATTQVVGAVIGAS